MLDRYTQINKSSKTEIEVNNYTPETIALNVTNIDNGFFVTYKRNSNEYLHLMGENPVILTYKSKGISDEDMQRRYGQFWRVHSPWEKIETKHPVKVVNIQYIGNDEFLFNLTKL